MIPCTHSQHLHTFVGGLKSFIRLTFVSCQTVRPKSTWSHPPPTSLRAPHSTCLRSFSVRGRCYNNSDTNTKWEFFNVPQEPTTVPDQQKPQRIIQDVIEAQWNPLPDEIVEKQEELYNIERGKTGVFDLEELLDLLREQRGKDICVIAIPKELDYADHMVIVTARSPKHMLALGTFIRKRFKSKHLLRTDVIPKLEGTKDNEDWIALDLVNIVLHIFCVKARELYDLETLWTVGSNFDDLTQKKESEVVRLLQLFE